MTRWLVLSGTLWLLALVMTSAQPGRSSFRGTIDQHPAIDYRGRAVADAVSRLPASILAFDGKQGYLRSVLAALDIPLESQVLVFSKTGIQHLFTGPENPRALYFNDHVVVGYIPGAPILEIASHDPRQGVIFYTVRQDPALPPAFSGRRDSRNRSLRELDLRTRLLKYRCSYMIYSPAFDGLPAEARAAVMSRMKQVLESRADGAVVQEILGETVTGWR